MPKSFYSNFKRALMRTQSVHSSVISTLSPSIFRNYARWLQSNLYFTKTLLSHLQSFQFIWCMGFWGFGVLGLFLQFTPEVGARQAQVF